MTAVKILWGLLKNLVSNYEELGKERICVMGKKLGSKTARLSEYIYISAYIK